MSVASEIQHGLDTPIATSKRLTAGLANMAAYRSIIEGVRGGIPLGLIMVKGAWESKGIATTQSEHHKDVGLYQFKVSEPDGDKEIAGKVYSYESLKNPTTATKAFVAWATKNADSLMATHPAWFTAGRDWEFWKCVWQFGMIGSGAMRHLLNAVGPGPNSYSRVVTFTKDHPEWFNEAAQKKAWGSQTGEVVAFRVMIGDRLMDVAKTIGGIATTAATAAPFAIGGIAIAAAIVIATVVVIKRRKSRTQPTTAASTTMSGFAGSCPMQLKEAGRPDSEFDRRQLRMGIKVEREHTNNAACAKAIAKAHLREIPDYYTRLAQMEKATARQQRRKKNRS